MRNFTKLCLSLALLFGVVGGVKATKVNASFSVATGCTWDSNTSTFGFTDVNGWQILLTGLPGGDISGYTRFHATLSNMSDNIDNIRLRIKDTSDKYADYNLVNGENIIDLAALATANPNCNFESINDITIWSPTSAAAGKTVDANNPASVKLENVYLEGSDPLYRDVYALNSKITFEQALASNDPFVLVQNGKVLCGPLSATDGSLTFKDVSEISNYSWTIKFEEDAANAGSYFMHLFDQNNQSKGYINGSVWSHTYLSNINKETSKGEQQDGALWTIKATNNGKYTITNLGVTEGNYNNKPNGNEGDRAAMGQGYLGITTTGYWANHVTIYNTSGEWEFYTLSVTQLPINDPLYYGWNKLVFSGSDKVTKNDETRFVRDANDWAPYWSETAKWELGSPFDASGYRYLVYYTQRNITQFGNENNNTGGSVFIRDANGTTFRGDDYNKYQAKGAENAVDYPAHTGSMWMNIWNKQRATVVDLQWLANTDKYGNDSECNVLDITKIKAFGFSGDFAIGGAFFTNTLPDIDNGDYKRSFTNEETPVYGNFGTICLPYSAVCCGAQLYEISGKTDNSIALVEHDGVMEAGKAYLYKTLEAKQQYWGNVRPETALYFFKAGYEQVNAPIANNGLIGTFTNITAPAGENFWVLSGNKFYDTEGSTVTIGANKAYVDTDKITNNANAGARSITIPFNDTTNGIDAVKDNGSAKRSGIYNVNGQRLNQPKKGLNIIDGKKYMLR